MWEVKNFYNFSERVSSKTPDFRARQRLYGPESKVVSVFLAVLCPAVQPHLTCATPLRPGNSITRGPPTTLVQVLSVYRCPLLTSSDLWSLRHSCSRKKLHARPRLFPSLWDGGDVMEVVVPPKYYEVDRVAATSGKTPLAVVLAWLFLF